MLLVPILVLLSNIHIYTRLLSVPVFLVHMNTCTFTSVYSNSVGTFLHLQPSTDMLEKELALASKCFILYILYYIYFKIFLYI